MFQVNQSPMIIVIHTQKQEHDSGSEDMEVNIL